MATLSTQNILTTGLAATYSAVTATTGDRFLPGTGVFLHVKNGSGASINVTVTTPASVDTDLAVGDRVVAVPAGADRFISVPDTLYRASDGLGTFVCSAVTTVTAAVLTV